MLRLGIGLQIKRALANIVAKLTSLYKTRVTADSGSTRTINSVETIYQWFKDNNLLDYIKFLWFAEAGIKIANPSDTLKRLSKGYSLDSTPNNWTQTVEANQPYLSGDISPTENYALKNPAGASRRGDFTELSYSTGDAWTVTFVGQWDGSNNAEAAFLGRGNDTASLISFRNSSVNRFRFLNESGASVAGAININHLAGKNIIVSFVAAGDGTLKIYVNGVLFETLTVATNVKFSTFLRGFNTASREFFGKCHYIDILNYELTSLIASYHAVLRAMITEIETVQIGSQHWATSNYDAVVTPMGTEIQEIQLATDTTWLVQPYDFTTWSLLGDAVIDSSTQFHTAGVSQGIRKLQSMGAAWYKITIEGTSTNPLSVGNYNNTVVFGQTSGGAFSEVFYGKNNRTAGILLRTTAADSVTITTLTVEEVGWAGLGDMYDGLIAQGKSAADAQKAAAAWCYYNNNPATGAIYGKLYNGYAAIQIQDDIDTWNAANPTNRFGYHVPTIADANSLSTTLGGDSVAGGRLKVAGTTFWNSPNTGADNSSGFSMLPGGFRTNTVGYSRDLKNDGVLHLIHTTPSLFRTYEDSAKIAIVSLVEYYLIGGSVRLIKD